VCSFLDVDELDIDGVVSRGRFLCTPVLMGEERSPRKKGDEKLQKTFKNFDPSGWQNVFCDLIEATARWR
jgi:hypothetical protein